VGVGWLLSAVAAACGGGGPIGVFSVAAAFGGGGPDRFGVLVALDGGRLLPSSYIMYAC
jgi:hypothetical protein